MFEYLSYILCLLAILVFFIYFYIRLKYGFWILQPVFHIYDFGYIFKPPGIIKHSLPEKNTYTNFKEIDTIIFSKLTPIQKTRFTNLIKTNYLQNKDNIFNPNFENINSYFIAHNDKCFISFYCKDEYISDYKKDDMIIDKRIIGVITSRPLNVFINNSQKSKFTVYYVDYLCVDKLYRKKGIAPQLIQTHHYNQRYLNENIIVSLFKREDELTGIIPLCVYSTYGFSVNKWTKPIELSKEYQLLEINSTNFRFIYDFIKNNNNNFDIIINADIANILELIKTKNVFIYAILSEQTIISCYFFRKTCVQVEKGLEVLTCFASICNCETKLFIQGFKISFWKISAEFFFGFCAIENISNNDIIINNIILKTKPLIISPTAYFFYNFAYPTFKSEKVLIIN